MSTTHEIIEEMREEGAGSRGIFYENYGSGIKPALVPLADLLTSAQDDYPELVDRVAKVFYRMR